MGRSKRRPGLRKRGEYWHIEKAIDGKRIYESTGQTDYRRAEEYYDRRILDIRQVLEHGGRPKLAFREAVEKFLREECPTKSLERAGYAFDKVLPFIGDLLIERVHEGSLSGYKETRQRAGVAAGTINKELGFVRRVLILAGRKWRYPNADVVQLGGALGSWDAGRLRFVFLARPRGCRALGGTISGLDRHRDRSLVRLEPQGANTAQRHRRRVGMKGWIYV